MTVGGGRSKCLIFHTGLGELGDSSVKTTWSDSAWLTSA